LPFFLFIFFFPFLSRFPFFSFSRFSLLRRELDPGAQEDAEKQRNAVVGPGRSQGPEAGAHVPLQAQRGWGEQIRRVPVATETTGVTNPS